MDELTANRARSLRQVISRYLIMPTVCALCHVILTVILIRTLSVFQESPWNWGAVLVVIVFLQSWKQSYQMARMRVDHERINENTILLGKIYSTILPHLTVFPNLSAKTKLSQDVQEDSEEE